MKKNYLSVIFDPSTKKTQALPLLKIIVVLLFSEIKDMVNTKRELDINN